MDEPAIIIGPDGKPQHVRPRALNSEEATVRMNAARAESLEAARIAAHKDNVIEAARVWHTVSWDDHDDAETALSEALDGLIKAEAESGQNELDQHTQTTRQIK